LPKLGEIDKTRYHNIGPDFTDAIEGVKDDGGDRVDADTAGNEQQVVARRLADDRIRVVEIATCKKIRTGSKLFPGKLPFSPAVCWLKRSAEYS
jgi:hypothetical protein